MSQGFCTNCGAAQMQASAFCAACGAPTTGMAPPTPGPHAQQPAAPPPQMPSPPAAPAAPAMTPAEAPQAYAPPSAPATYTPPQATTQSKVLRWVIIVIGVGIILLGLVRIMNGIGMMTGGSRGAGPSTPVISEVWLTDTWAQQNGPHCSSWVRFNRDYTLTDVAGNSGTWRLSLSGSASATLTLAITGQAPRTVTATRSADDSLIIGNDTWRRTTC